MSELSERPDDARNTRADARMSQGALNLQPRRHRWHLHDEPGADAFRSADLAALGRDHCSHLVAKLLSVGKTVARCGDRPKRREQQSQHQ